MTDSHLPKAFFVSGTDTGVGKTVLSAILSLGLNAHYWKPIQSGGKSKNTREPESALASADLTDSEFMRLILPPERILPERYCLSEPLSPHLAARLDGKSISLTDFSLPAPSAIKHLIVEGAGGLLVPLNDRGDKIVDLIAHLCLPVLLACRSTLGTINHSLLSIEALASRKIEILGAVMMGEKNEENRLAIENFGNVKVLAEIPHLNDLSRQSLFDCYVKEFLKGEKRNAPDNLASIHSNAYSRSSS